MQLAAPICELLDVRAAGAQIPLEDVPSVQKEVVVRCRQAGKAVIVASHLLQSMIEYPTPTRAEVPHHFSLCSLWAHVAQDNFTTGYQDSRAQSCMCTALGDCSLNVVHLPCRWRTLRMWCGRGQTR